MGFVMHGEPAGQASTVHSLEQVTNDERVEKVVYEMKKVAFICVHNSCRSQIAEALGRRFADDAFESYFAGIETRSRINQDAVRLTRGSPTEAAAREGLRGSSPYVAHRGRK